MLVPSYSTHFVEPVKGSTSRQRCVFQVPISKSKSCEPFRLVAACAGSGVSWARETEPTITKMQATNVTEKFFMYLVRSYRCVVSQRVKTATWLAQELF